jgi:CheY-like chemotaxis protein
MTVLLVEDNEMNRDMLSRRLARRGFDVLLASNGSEAVAMALSRKPDIILMDMSLPVMDGWEATRRIKADPLTSSLPIIALTAHALPAERERALAAGCEAFETKPIDFPKLLSLMETFKR